MSRQAPHLTEDMREAAYAYASRLRKGDPSLTRTEALATAKAFAEKNLLTLDGHLKPRHRKKKPKAA